MKPGWAVSRSGEQPTKRAIIFIHFILGKYTEEQKPAGFRSPVKILLVNSDFQLVGGTALPSFEQVDAGPEKRRRQRQPVEPAEKREALHYLALQVVKYGLPLPGAFRQC